MTLDSYGSIPFQKCGFLLSAKSIQEFIQVNARVSIVADLADINYTLSRTAQQEHGDHRVVFISAFFWHSPICQGTLRFLTHPSVPNKANDAMRSLARKY